MTTARESHENNIVLGAGELWLDVLDGDKLTGERYLGDTIGASLTITSERSTIASGDGAIALDLADVTRSVSRVLACTLHDSSIENWALFILGETASEAVTAVSSAALLGGRLGPISNDRWYRIGASPANPAGIGAFTPNSTGPVMVFDEAAGNDGKKAVVVGNYEIDETNGMVLIKSSANIAGKYVEVTGTVAAKTIELAQVKSSVRTIRAAVRYIEDPAAGKARHVYARMCTIVPSGEAQLKSRDTEQQFQLQCVVLDPPTETAGKYPAIAIYTQ